MGGVAASACIIVGHLLDPTRPAPMKIIDCAAPYKLVRSRHGWFLASHQDVYIGRSLLTYGEYAEYEWQTLEQLLRSRRRDAVEVGANIGTHTVPMAQVQAAQGRRVLAVEAQPMVFRQLCANLALNAVMNADAHNVACSDAPGWLSFDAPPADREFNFGAVSMRDDGAALQRIAAVRLDDLLPASYDVGLLKIDVEGFEQRVLEGSTATIARCRPLIYLENDRLEKSRALIEWLWARSYKLMWHIPMMFNPKNFAREKRNIYPNVGSFNMLAIPIEDPLNVAGAQLIDDADAHPARPRSAPPAGPTQPA